MTIRREPHDEIGQLLRRGDPYQGQELSSIERQRIQARMRTATLRPVPGLAGSRFGLAALGVLATLWLASWLPLSLTRVSAPEAERLPESVSVPSALDDDPTPHVAAAVVPEVDTSRAVDPSPVMRRTAALPAAPRLVASPPGEIPSRPARALRFTAPQGTRIIWTLDPDFEPTETRR